MGYVYRYTDLKDNTIKYVGIVWSEHRSLKQRIDEHQKYDKWCKNSKFKIEYITEKIKTRTDAEYLESHYISLYKTDRYYNTRKAGWGISSFLPDRNDWMLYKQDDSSNSDILKNNLYVEKGETRMRENIMEDILYISKNNNFLLDITGTNEKPLFEIREIFEIYQKYQGGGLYFYSTSYEEIGNALVLELLKKDGNLVYYARSLIQHNKLGGQPQILPAYDIERKAFIDRGRMNNVKLFQSSNNIAYSIWIEILRKKIQIEKNKINARFSTEEIIMKRPGWVIGVNTGIRVWVPSTGEQALIYDTSLNVWCSNLISNLKEICNENTFKYDSWSVEQFSRNAKKYEEEMDICFKFLSRYS